MNTGLAAMGLPPSLPNWDELVDQGIEYAAYQVASQAGVGGVPGVEQLTEKVAEKVVKGAIAAMKVNRGGGPGLPDWLTLDVGQEPAVLTLAVERLSSGGIDTNAIKLAKNPLYQPAFVPLPSKWPAGPIQKPFGILNIPVTLRSNIDGFIPPTFADGTPFSDYDTSKYARDFWQEKLNNTPCVHLIVAGYALVGPLKFEKGPLAVLNVDPTAARSFPPFLPCPVK
jgi:hypothetical protein